MKGKRKEKLEKKTKLLGPSPASGEGKLKQLKGALKVKDNYGVALDPEPKVIPHREVWKELETLKFGKRRAASSCASERGHFECYFW